MLRVKRIATVVSILTIVASLVRAQTIAPTMFEVATVKPSNSAGTVAIRRLPGGRWVATNTSLRQLIIWAYNVTDERLVGAPGWLNSARFDVVAHASIGAPTLDQLHLMVQSLLADRFHLQVHREQRQLPFYRMEAVSGGPKVHVLDKGTEVSQDPFTMTVLGRLSGKHVTAQMLAKILANQLGRYVKDDTGFDSVFDFTLVWRPEGVSPEDMPPDDDRPSVFTAIREQLGFNLIPDKGPVEVIAIDHVDKHPTAN